MELRIGGRSVDLRWSTVVVAPVPGPQPSSSDAATLFDHGADAVLVDLNDVERDPAWPLDGVAFCCTAADESAAARALALGASFVIVPDRSVAAAVVAAGCAGAVVVEVDPVGDDHGGVDTDREPAIDRDAPPSVPMLRDLRAGVGGIAGGGTVELADVAVSALLDAESTHRVVLIDDPRPARRCADLVETLRREQAGVPL